MTGSSLESSQDIASPEAAAEVLALAAGHGLHLVAHTARVDTSGLDFLVVHAYDADGVPWIVRRPRRPDVVASTQVEARVLALVGPRIPAAVPQWRVHAADVIAYPRISGTPAVRMEGGAPAWQILDPAAPASAFLDSYARTIAALQAVPPAEARAAGVPTTDIASARAELARMMDVTRAAVEVPPRVWARWQRWLADADAWPRHVALVHGDLHPGHMLLDEGARLVGVIDWTEARVTDPTVDLAMFLGCFGRAALEVVVPRIAAAGGQVWPGIVEHAGERWAAFAAVGVEWALRTGNAWALEHAKAQLAAIAGETVG